MSCQEAASYLQSFFGLRDAQWPSSQMVENIQQDYRLTSETVSKYLCSSLAYFNVIQ